MIEVGASIEEAVVSTHLFGSREGYRTLARSVDVTDAEDAELSTFGFGQTADREVLERLETEPTAYGRPLAGGRVAITRIFAGPADESGRATLELRTILISPASIGDLLSTGFGWMLQQSDLWNRAAFEKGRTTRIVPIRATPDRSPAAEEAFAAWADVVLETNGDRRTTDPGEAPLRAVADRPMVVLEPEPEGSTAIAALAASLTPTDLANLRWGVRLLSTGAPVDVATLAPSGRIASGRTFVRHRMGSGDLGIAAAAIADSRDADRLPSLAAVARRTVVETVPGRSSWAAIRTTLLASAPIVVVVAIILAIADRWRRDGAIEVAAATPVETAGVDRPKGSPEGSSTSPTSDTTSIDSEPALPNRSEAVPDASMDSDFPEPSPEPSSPEPPSPEPSSPEPPSASAGEHSVAENDRSGDPVADTQPRSGADRVPLPPPTATVAESEVGGVAANDPIDRDTASPEAETTDDSGDSGDPAPSGEAMVDDATPAPIPDPAAATSSSSSSSSSTSSVQNAVADSVEVAVDVALEIESDGATSDTEKGETPTEGPAADDPCVRCRLDLEQARRQIDRAASAEAAGDRVEFEAALASTIASLRSIGLDSVDGELRSNVLRRIRTSARPDPERFAGDWSSLRAILCRLEAWHAVLDEVDAIAERLPSGSPFRRELAALRHAAIWVRGSDPIDAAVVRVRIGRLKRSLLQQAETSDDPQASAIAAWLGLEQAIGSQAWTESRFSPPPPTPIVESGS